MLAGRVWRDDRLRTAFGKPVAQALGVVGSVGEEAQRTRHDGQQSSSAIEVVGIAWGEFEGDGPALIVGQRMDLRRAATARASDGVAEGPPFAPAAERCALMCVESTAIVPIMPVEPVSA